MHFIDNMSHRLVIPDIHGCVRTLQALLDQVAPTMEDQLFFLGDYIDKGPDSAGVIDLLLDLKSKGYRLHFLRGNHEENFMVAFQDWADNLELFRKFVTRINKAGNLLDDHGLPIERYWRFMEATDYYIQLPEAILVHAGLRFDRPDPFEDRVALLELRRMQFQREKVGGRMLIHGHVPTALKTIEAAIESRGPIIPLDNGCVYADRHRVYDHTQMGHLLCLNLDTWELHRQPYID